MLKISRRQGTSFTIGDNITVYIEEVKGGQVKVGIDAPRNIEILRDDIKCKKKL